MITEHSFDTGTVTVNYAEGPVAGPALVLLHGGSARWQDLAGFLPTLVEAWHIYAPDLRGHGQSGRVPGRYRLQDYVDDLAVLQQQVTGPAILFGHSLGGMLAVMLAGQHPHLVRAVVVGDAPLSRDNWQRRLADQSALLRTFRDLAGSGRSEAHVIAELKEMPIVSGQHTTPVRAQVALGEDDPWFGWMAANLRQVDPDTLTALLDDFEMTVAGYDMHRLLPAIACPVLLLQADPAYGAMMTDAEVEQAVALLARPTHVQLAQVDHGFNNELVIQELLRFLKSL
jgi:pimeloyl-ACP methyl ester carboxylesterase